MKNPSELANKIAQSTVAALLLLAALVSSSVPTTASEPQNWPSSSVIYCIYPSIFSPSRNFQGVTAEMGQLKSLGVTCIWLMPVTPIGHAINGHPAIGSPYCVHDYFAVNPDYGTAADFQALVNKAHQLGIEVILDEVLNHTSWDNALTTQHPEYYVHTDGNAQNPASIKMAFNYADVAQLNYASPGLRAYMIRMLQFWITRYGVDGFRFDSADDPDGPGRMIPADFWQEMGRKLHAAKPDVMLLEEGESRDLALRPFTLDYGWSMYDAIKAASNGANTTHVRNSWDYQQNSFPVSMKHMSIQDDWDDPRDVNTFGGPAGAMAVSAFYFTDTGVPLIYNGMEIGNAAEAVNPHAPINWNSGDPRFTKFYRALIRLRRSNPALQTGSMTWLPNTMPTQVLTYERSGSGTDFLVEVNLGSVRSRGFGSCSNWRHMAGNCDWRSFRD